jgi:hypothetical protein
MTTMVVVPWHMRHKLRFIKQECDSVYSLLQGYTPLHMAMQFGHEEIYNILVKVYGKYCNNFKFCCFKVASYLLLV